MSFDRSVILTTFTGASMRYLRPFVRGEHDYATNGKIVVRMPRTAPSDIYEPGEIAAEKVFERVNWDGPFSPPPSLALPARRRTECSECDGSGTKHSCPSCDCACDECDGAGWHDGDEGQSVNLEGCPVALSVARRVLSLRVCNLRLGPTPTPGHNWPFLFDGGEGVFATRTAPAETHLQLEAA